MKRKAAVLGAVFFIFLFGAEVVVCGSAMDAGGQMDPLRLKVTLEKVYVDGEVSQEHSDVSAASWEEFWARYKDWSAVDVGRESVVLRKHVEDISPLLKANGYFGLNDEGVLAIFNGKPPYSQIIQSFFQIDVKKLESRKQVELQKGIPIRTRDRYMEVLESFKPYSACDESRN
ncbi:BofC C-terminal domain-containing protein [Bacillus sp. B-jedd]|uniref:BofC C-terminal domain-containing protein n=1 Tax=Bacillus sp. B-jedd TaxID=1476857 RepID=UPI0005155567|nr:BofC C-terminal domain-containing protein [Bacillus sp. B-jedd]CEG28006.1 Bypass of forespore C, intercompartmental signaling factor [Bacillus sp. B-jedd]